MSFIIRNLEETDIAEVMEFIDACENLVLERDSMYWMLARFFANTCFVAVAESKIIGVLLGFVSQVDPKIAYVKDLGTGLVWRKMGVATALLTEFEKTVGQLGVQKIFLTTSFDSKNRSVIRFYEHYGFTGEKIWKGSQERLGFFKNVL